MGLDVVKRLKNDAKERQKTGGSTAAPKYEPAAKYFVSSNWKNLLEKRPSIAPKAAAGGQQGQVGKNMVALDCEMVGVGPNGQRSALARLSIVDAAGDVLIDRYVIPSEEVTDYRTRITGIRESTLQKKGVLREHVALERAAELLAGKVVIGHGLSNDFKVLNLTHPVALIRDTALFRPLRPPGRQKKTPSLRGLAAHWLNQNIHDGAHDSVEDARVALQLYRIKSRLWEKQLRSVMKDLEGSARTAPEEEEEDEGEPVDAETVGDTPPKAKRIAKKRKKQTHYEEEEVEENQESSDDDGSEEDEPKPSPEKPAPAPAQVYKNPGKKMRKRLRMAAQAA